MHACTLLYFRANALLKGLDTVFGCRTVGVLITNSDKSDQESNTSVLMLVLYHYLRDVVQ